MYFWNLSLQNIWSLTGSPPMGLLQMPLRLAARRFVFLEVFSDGRGTRMGPERKRFVK